jgi:hypothetical protein
MNAETSLTPEALLQDALSGPAGWPAHLKKGIEASTSYIADWRRSLVHRLGRARRHLEVESPWM